MDERPTELLQGTLDLMILRILSTGRRHGYAVAKRIEQTTRGALLVPQGSLYPALHRLEARGMIEAEWGKTDTGRRAKFYLLTAEGRRRLGDETATWRQFAHAVNLVLQHG